MDKPQPTSEFLITWKPEHWPVSNVERMLLEYKAAGSVTEPWRMSAHNRARPGDRVWLLKQGSPRRIFGVGYVDGGKVDVEVGETKKPGFPIRFERLVDPRATGLIEEAELLEVLTERELSAQASGIRLLEGQPERLSALADVAIEAEHFDDYADALRRVVQTALDTVAGANGQEVMRRIKEKTYEFTSRSAFDAHVKELLIRQRGRCALTGLEMRPDSHGGDNECCLSLDRIDSSQGYAPGNLQLVCRFANRWKSDGDNDEFCRLIALLRNA